MAYKEKYPLDITPQGDTVQDSIKKNRDELLNVAQQMELKAGVGGTGGGGTGGLRNRVLNGKLSNGEFSFLTGDNLSVMIDGSQTPVLLSFADGFNDYGAVDYVTTINRKQSVWSLPANSTSYLYVERSASGGLTYGSTTLEPMRQPNAPAAATDKMYYNTTNEKMYVYTGTYWKSMLRVIVGVVKTDSTSVKSIKYYRPGFSTDDILDKAISTDKISDGAVQSKNIGNEQIENKHLSTEVKTLIENVRKEIDELKPAINDVLKKVYPVGAIYCSTISTNPNALLGFGEWEAVEQGRVLLSQGSNYKAGTTGGRSEVTLTVKEMPPHDHFGNTNQAGGHSHNASTNNAGTHAHGAHLYTLGSTGNMQGVSVVQKSGLGMRYSSDVYIDQSGDHSHSVNVNNAGDHSHSIRTDGEGKPFSILPPYLSVYIWKRVS